MTEDTQDAAPLKPVQPHGASRTALIGFAVVIGLLLVAFVIEYAADRRERRRVRTAPRRRR